jgi:hypothetical protein
MTPRVGQLLNFASRKSLIAEAKWHHGLRI